MKYRANPVVVKAVVITKVERHPDFPASEDKRFILAFQENGEEKLFIPDEALTSRMTPVPGDYIVWQEDGYCYLNPKAVFEKKYAPVVHVHSTSDERVVNNVMRHNYRKLEEEEKQQMQGIKDLGMQFYNFLHGIGGTNMDQERLASRELSLAATKIEEAVMWAVKHITI